MLPVDLQRWFQTLIQDSPFFFAILDEQYRYVAVNKRYQDVSGISAEKLIGKNDQQVFGESNFQSLNLLYQQALSDNPIETEVTLTFSGRSVTLHAFVYSVATSAEQTHLIFQAIDTSDPCTRQFVVRILTKRR